MKLSAHAVLSAAAGAGVYAVSRSSAAALSCFLSGVLIDLDHLPDYLLLSGEKPSVSGFFSWNYEAKWRRIYLLLHSYELLFAAAVYAFCSGSAVWSGIASGAGLHLAADQLFNRRLPGGYCIRSGFYFFVFRYRSGFLRENMLFRRGG